MKTFNERPLCNKNPSSAPTINGKKFILCWRCSTAILGATVCFITLLFFNIIININFIFLIIIFVLPGTIDFVLTKNKIVKASNKRRAITGFFLGISVALTIELLITLLP